MFLAAFSCERCAERGDESALLVRLEGGRELTTQELRDERGRLHQTLALRSSRRGAQRIGARRADVLRLTAALRVNGEEVAHRREVGALDESKALDERRERPLVPPRHRERKDATKDHLRLGGPSVREQVEDDEASLVARRLLLEERPKSLVLRAATNAAQPKHGAHRITEEQ